MATAAYNQAIPASPTVTTIFDPVTEGVKACAAFRVNCLSGSAAPVLVQVLSLHLGTDRFRINPGEGQTFMLLPNGLGVVTCQGDGGIATIDYGIVTQGSTA